MYYSVSENYYTVSQVLKIVGSDTFGESEWQEIKSAEKHLSPSLEEAIGERLSIFCRIINYSQYYQPYTAFNEIDCLYCKALIKDFLESDKGSLLHSKNRLPLSFKELEKRLKNIFKYLIIRNRLTYMFEHIPLPVFIVDQWTGSKCEIYFTAWRKPDFLEDKELEFNFVTGLGSYVRYNDVTHKVESFRGVVFVETEAFEKLRNNELSKYLYTVSLEGILDQEHPKSSYKENFQSKDTYTTPEVEALKRVLANYGITENNQPTVKKAKEYFKKEYPDISDNIAHALATVIRTSKVRKGGYHRSPLFQNHQTKF